MKYLQDYMNDDLSKLLTECGAFYAFSNKQFNEQKREGVVYTSLGSGLICNKVHTVKLINGLDEILQKAIKQDLEENGKEAIIKRELYNYECIYTGDIENAVDALSVYGFSNDEILSIFKIELIKSEHYLY